MCIIVKCDNCGAEYVAFDTDKNKGPYYHGMCCTCFLPMTVKNPFYKESKMKNSICDKCSSRGYCRNRENGMMACNNFNKFPKATGSYENWLRGKEREG